MKYEPHKLPQTPEQWLFNFAVNAALYQGMSTVATWVINQNLKMHYSETRTPMHARYYQSYRGPSQVQRWGKTMGMIALNPATPVVSAAFAAGAVSVGTSVAYEQSVNKNIRQGRSGFWFGLFASGFGSVVG